MTQMMRTNADALRIVTTSHVDLAKTIAVAKGLPRNAAMYVPPPPPTNVVEEDDDDEYDDEYEDEEARATNWCDVALPIAEQIAPAIPGLLALLPQRSGAKSRRVDRSAVTPSPAPHDEVELAQEPAARSPDDGMRKPTPTVQARVMRDPVLMRKVMTIKAQLDAEEMAQLMRALERSGSEEQEHLLEQLKATPEDRCVALCRELLAVLNEPLAMVMTPESPTS